MRSASVRWTAGSAVVALMIFAIVDVFHTFIAIGHYEYRITVVTHGQPDVPVAALAYELLAHVVDELGYVLGFRKGTGTTREVLWTSALVLAVAAVSVWLHRAGGTLRREKATLGWISAAAALKVVSAAYDLVAAPPRPSVGGVLATRPIAYPLWILSTTVLVVAALRVARTIRRDHRCGAAAVVANPDR